MRQLGELLICSYYIPKDFSNDTVSGSIELKANDASNGNSGASYIAACIDDFAWCLTHSFRSAGEYSIPGRARTDQYDRIADPVVNNPTIGLTEPIFQILLVCCPIHLLIRIRIL